MNSQETLPSWTGALEEPRSGAHYVQFYGVEDQSLVDNVTRFLAEGFRRGDNVIVIAAREHTAAFLAQLNAAGFDAETAATYGRATFLDAHDTLALFMVNGRPDWQKFEAAISSVLRKVSAYGNPAGLRAYGEMVGILWTQGNSAGAVELEGFWNRLLAAHDFSLFCAYPIDLLENEVAVSDLNAVLCGHTHLIPMGGDSHLETAIMGAMDEVLGHKAEVLRQRIEAQYRPSWASMRASETYVCWLKNNLPDQAQQVFANARDRYRSAVSRSSAAV